MSSARTRPLHPLFRTRHHTVAASLLLALVSSLAPRAARAERSATLSTAINLPQGPASIEGHGQRHSVSPSTGLPTLSYEIELPPGRAGLAPTLTLQHEPGAGAGVIGLGWTMAQPVLERSTRLGLARPDEEAPPWVLRGPGRPEELVELPSGQLRARIEGERPVIVTALPDGGMEARTVDGTRYTFGTRPQSRLERDGYAFRLELDAIEDNFGNRVEYQYTRPTGDSPPLLSAITWNDGRARVDVAYEPRPDPVVSRAPGWTLALGHRVASITSSADGAAIRTTRLGYARRDETPSSLLVEIATAAEGGAATPTWRMQYRALEDVAAPEPRVIANAPAVDPSASGYALVDVDGDALPDLLHGEPGSWRYRQNVGDFALASAWRELPTAPSLTVGAGSRFADLDGDGVEDLLAQPGPGLGELWSFAGGGAQPFATSDTTALELSVELDAEGLALVDLNLDGHVDILFHGPDDGFVWLRDADDPARFESAISAPLPPPGLRLGDPGVQLADLDGDRLPELVRVIAEDDRVLAAAGLGFGAFDVAMDMVGVPALAPEDTLELQDINGDGACDLIRVGRYEATLRINQLDGGFARVQELAWPTLEDGERVLLSDLDGDGTRDILRVDPEAGTWRAWEFMSEKPGLLTRFENGLGYSLELEYDTAAGLSARAREDGEPWETTVPTQTPVVTRTVEDDGFGWRRVVEYGYRDGWYDPSRAEFRGFARLSERRAGDEFADERTVHSDYDLGRESEARKQLLVAQETWGPEGLLRRERSEYTVHEHESGHVRVARRSATVVDHLEGADEHAMARVRSEWDHDEWGNVLEQRELGRVDPETDADLEGDERVTVYTYAAPQDAWGPRDRVAWTEVTDGDGARVSATRFYYDGPALRGLDLGELGPRGALSRRARWVEDDEWVDELRQTLDERGNIVELRDAEDGRLTRVYDDAGRFPIEERLVLDGATGVDALLVRARWDARFGVPIEVTDPSGQSTEIAVDGLGRVTAIIEPGDSRALPTAAFAYFVDGATPPAIVAYERQRSDDPRAAREIQHLDGMGRLRQRVHEAGEGERAVLAEAVSYAIDGELATRVSGQFVPTSALELGAAPALDPAWPAESRCRDALGRERERVDADGRVTQIIHGPLRSEQQDHEDLFSSALDGRYADTPRRTSVDGLGRVVEITDLLEDRAIVHRYRYDAADQLIAHVDPEGHETLYERDGLGSLRVIDSPDAGLITQRFDATGRLRERVDATGARVEWTFDPAGRLRTTKAFTPEGALEDHARYYYDRPRVRSAGRDAARSIGRLVGVEDAAGTVDYVHDERGRVVGETRRFTGLKHAITLSRGAEFDAQGRLLRERFPDGTTLEHTLDLQGLEIAAPGFVESVEHDALGRWTSMRRADGVIVGRALDRAGRVLAESATRTSGARLRELSHQYDAAGLLAETTDLVGATPRSPALDQRFRYDDLRRLVAAEAAYGDLSWRYTDDGNLLQQGRHALKYDGLGPHAATRLDDQRLFYDEAGQLHRVDGDGPIPAGSWSFNARGRVASFTAEDGRRVEHVYDHTGARAIRRERDASGQLVDEVLYFGNAEVRRDKLIRWIFVAGERVAEAPTALPAPK